MDDLDFIERKKKDTLGIHYALEIVYGAHNAYLEEIYGEKEHFVKKSKVKEYLNNLEKKELDDEFNESEKYTKLLLEEENSSYNSRLNFSLINDFVEVDLCSENIIKKMNLGDGSYSICAEINEKSNFCLYDIYLKIEKTTGEFTKKDLLDFVDFKLQIALNGQNTFEKDFFSMCFLELIENHDILIEPNIIYVKAITFENLIYGIPNYFLINGGLKICSAGLNLRGYPEYKIDLIYSGKNIANIKPEHLENDGFEQLVISSQTYKYNKKISSKDKIEIKFEHAVSLMMFFLYNEDIETDELVNTNIDAVGLGLNKDWFIWWEDKELIKVNFLGINLCVLAIDPALRDYKKFCNFIKLKANYSMPKTINFSRLDYTDVYIEYDSNNKYNLYVNCIYANKLKFKSGMVGLAFSN